jgi:hypothetical protein
VQKDFAGVREEPVVHARSFRSARPFRVIDLILDIGGDEPSLLDEKSRPLIPLISIGE